MGNTKSRPRNNQNDENKPTKQKSDSQGDSESIQHRKQEQELEREVPALSMQISAIEAEKYEENNTSELLPVNNQEQQRPNNDLFPEPEPKFEDLQQQYELLSQAVQDHKDARRALRKHNQRLLEDLRSEISDLQRKLDDSGVQIEKLEAEISDAYERSAIDRELIEDLKTENKVLKQQLADCQTRNAETKEEATELGKIYLGLIENLRSGCCSLIGELDSETQIGKLELDITSAEEQSETSKKEISVLAEENLLLHKNLLEGGARLERTDSRLTDISEYYKDLVLQDDEKVSRLEDENVAVKRQLDNSRTEATGEISMNKEKVDNFSQENENLEEERGNLEDKQEEEKEESSEIQDEKSEILEG